ncbi:hypothetical protein JCM6882_005343 [Rhodosporidiobolus microsporus]
MVPLIPLDIVDLIADHLSASLPDRQTQERRDIGTALCLVCRDWREVGLKLAWGDCFVGVVFPPRTAESDFFRLVRNKDVARSIRRLRVASSSAEWPAGTQRGLLLEVCPSLRELQIGSSRAVVEEALQLPSDIDDYPTLQSLQLGVATVGLDASSKRPLGCILSSFPSLETFFLRDSAPSTASDISVASSHPPSIAAYPSPALHNLSLSFSSLDPSAMSQTLPLLHFSSAHIQTLILGVLPSFDPLANALGACTALHTLRLTLTPDAFSAALLALPHTFSSSSLSFKELVLTAASHLPRPLVSTPSHSPSPSTLSHFLSSLPLSLTTLRIAHPAAELDAAVLEAFPPTRLEGELRSFEVQSLGRFLAFEKKVEEGEKVWVRQGRRRSM